MQLKQLITALQHMPFVRYPTHAPEPTACHLLLENGGALCLETGEPIALEHEDKVDE